MPGRWKTAGPPAGNREGVHVARLDDADRRERGVEVQEHDTRLIQGRSFP